MTTEEALDRIRILEDRYEDVCSLLANRNARITTLESAIAWHRGQRADDRCIEDDDRLYEALGDGIKCDRRVGCQLAMAANCIRFIRNRTEGGGWPSYAELEALLAVRDAVIRDLSERIAAQSELLSRRAESK